MATSSTGVVTRMIYYGFALIIGLLLRYLCSHSGLQGVFEGRIEISTPVNSWKRVVEGVYLQKLGVSPYSGDVFHEVPLALAVYQFLVDLPTCYIQCLFMCCDVISAMLLALASKLSVENLVKKEKKLKAKLLASSKPKGSEPDSSLLSLLVNENNTQNVPLLVFYVYLLCPFSILSCAGQATTVFSNMLLASFFVAVAAKWWLTSTILVAVLTYHSFYPCMLVVPLVIAVYQHKASSMWPLGVLWIFGGLQGIFMYLSFEATGHNWQFLHSTYGAILTVPDLTPNIGLFWYFFTEMFDQFRSLFLWTFQINVFIYTLPLSLRFRSNPILLLYALLFVMAIFKSYPCLGDYALPMALLPMWKHTFQHMRQSFLVGCMLAATFLLAPLLWHLWIYAGSANSNFYFGITLAFNTAQIFLLTDLLFAVCKRDYYLQNKEYLDEKGKPLRLDLK